MSLLRTKSLQIGQDGTATNNFTLYQPGVPDGTLRIGNGNNGSVTDAITLSSSGSVDLNNNTLHFNTAQSQYINPSHTADGIMLVHGGYGLFHVLNNNTDSLAYYTSNTKRMEIDTDGNVTMPNKVRFYGNTFSNTTQTAGGVIPICTNIVQNTNSWYNTSTGIFTAPVSGVYQFSWAYLHQNLVDAANIDGGFLLNGVFIFGGSRYNAAENGYGGYVGEKCSVTPYLSANDTFAPRSGVSNDTSWNFSQNGTWGFLSACLIG